MSTESLVKLPAGAKLDELKLEISQDPDCCASVETDNVIEITTPDGGGGKYIVISGRWAMGEAAEIDQFADMLKELLSRLN